MKKLLAVLTILFLSSCNQAGHNFNYDRNNSCVINYGYNGFSVIIDGNKTFIRNNRMNAVTSITTIRIKSRSYSSNGRYFPDSMTGKIIQDLSDSQKTYIGWYDNLNASTVGNKTVHRNIIDTSGFSAKYKDCISLQKSRS